MNNVTYKSYALYKDVDILIDAEHHYLFNKCHESLKGLKFKILEVDEQSGNLVAFYVTFLGFVKPITVNVLKIENSETLHKIILQLEGDDFAERSRVINRFINRLISKPINADHKTKD